MKGNDDENDEPDYDANDDNAAAADDDDDVKV